MTPERWQRVNQLFHSVLQREPADRSAFLYQACAGDHELRKEVESLIESHEEPDSFIDSPALRAGAGLLGQAQPDLSAGTLLGHYEIVSLLGSGGMGQVYLAQDNKLGRKVALKLLPAGFTKDEQRVRRFAQEARAVSALNHPNILTIYDVDEEDGIHFIATEFIEGETLRQRIVEHRLEVSEALSIAVQVASALSAAHQTGIVHRDIKPENIMLRADGYVKVLDFGLAKLTERRADNTDTESPRYSAVKTDTGVIIGTVSYMSPEQAKGQPIDERSDVFSFGLMLYEMLTGERAFRRDSDVETLHAIIHEEPPRLSGLKGKVIEAIEGVLRRCLEKEANRRYASGVDLLSALENAVSGLPSSANMHAWGRVWRSPLRGLGGMIAAAIVITLVIGSIVWFYPLRSSTKSSSSSLPPMKVVPFTSLPGQEYLPSLSPDGNLIAFGWNGERGAASGASSIYVKQIGSDSPVRLTADIAYNDWGPVWSPDGQRIAFNRSTETEGSIYVVPYLGGAARKLIAVGPSVPLGGIATLDWSPDGRFIAFSYRDPYEEPTRIFLVSPDTLARQTLTSPPAQTLGDLNPAFSPDGQSVAFFRHVSAGAGDIYTVPVDGGEPRRLTFDNANLNGLTWSADGREVIFSSRREGGMSSLWRIPASGGAAERILVGESFYFPRVSRRLNRLTFTNNSPEDVNIYRIDLSKTSDMTRQPTKLIASTRHDSGPQFSPDGRRIAFNSNRSGVFEVWVCDSNGANLIQATHLKTMSGSPSWSPDGQQIAFDSYEGSNGDIYASSLGGPPYSLVTGDADDHLPSWSVDGNWIYFQSNRTGDYQLWKVPAHGGEAVPVIRQNVDFLNESPDGKYLYYFKAFGTQELWRASSNGGEELRVLDTRKLAAGVIVAGTVVNDGLYYIEETKDEVVLKFVDFATRHERRLAGLGKVDILPFRIAVSPDRRQILYSQTERPGVDIMLVENFH